MASFIIWGSMKISPSDNSYATFCALATGYRMYCVMAEALSSGIIDRLDEGDCTIAELMAATALKPEEGGRFIELLLNVGLIEQYDGRLYLSRFSRTYLGRNSPSSQRQVIRFEPALMANWQQLGTVLREGQGALIRERSEDEYRERLQTFQRAMSEAAVIRSAELWDAVADIPERGTIIDIGAGDGTYLRQFLARHPLWNGIACDLPDVCEQTASGQIPHNLAFHPCNILEPTELDALAARHRAGANLLLFSNICHCYSPEDNKALLRQAGKMLADDGRLLIHDFFRDANSFGALYDLHMLVNTYNGRSYTTAETIALLEDAGFPGHSIIELPSFSSVLVATRAINSHPSSSLFTLKNHALSHGFYAAVELAPSRIRAEAWVRAKCNYGCAMFGKRWSCPPHAMNQDEFEELIGCYSRALLVAGQPPLKDFQEKLLALEREAFLRGFKKALVFSGGPCCWCESCDDTKCRFPEKRRPSLESCGCDVFALAESCGIKIAPLRNSDEFVQYVGLLLIL